MTKLEFKYFDIQVNGYARIDFNSLQFNSDQADMVYSKLTEDNVEGILATIITDDFDRMIKKINNIVSIINNNKNFKEIVKGLHIEGPFLNPENGYRGAHPEKSIVPANIEMMKQILDASEGLVKLVTLAPECDHDNEVTEYLALQNIVVSAGHSNASIEDLKKAIDKGLKMFTHLGNGTPTNLPRHDNIVNRVLSLADQLYVSFIADNIHIPIFALKNYLRTAGFDRTIIISDAMAAASAPPGDYSISEISVTVGNDRIVKEKGKENLAGSAITMKESKRLLEENLDIKENSLKKILKDNAKKLLRLDSL